MWVTNCPFSARASSTSSGFVSGRTPYPVERTLLTTGIVEAAMRARARDDHSLETPQLEFSYQAQDFTAMREMGASWKIITEHTPEPKGIVPHGLGGE